MTTTLDTSLLAAVMLLVAIVGGYIAKWVRVPRVVAYIVGGVALRYLVGRTETPDRVEALVASLGFVNELALGLILFIIGDVFEAARLKATRGALRSFSPSEIGLTALLTSAGCALAAWTLPGMSLSMSITVGLLLGAVAVATAPAATWFVLREYDAKGPTTSHLLVMTGINNMASIIGFHVVLVLCVGLGWIKGIQPAQGVWWLDLLFVSLGSLALGSILGVLLSVFHSRLPLREMILMFFATLFLLSAGDGWVRATCGFTFNPMVTCLAMGAVFANVARDPGYFEAMLETVSMPIFALFFVLAGYNLHLGELPHLGVLGVVYLVARTVGKVYGVRRAVDRLGEATKVTHHAGLGLLCQAGVAVFLGDFLVRHWHDPMALKINAVILASVAINELVGPLLVKRIVIRAGEVKAVTLLRPGFLRPTWISPAPGLRNLVREYRSGKVKAGTIGKPLTAKHLMRTNVHFLPATAKFEEILSFVERSRFHDFPVADENGAYVGVVHFRRIRDQIYGTASADLLTAATLADAETPVVTPDTEVSVLLELFHKHNLGEIAVVDNTAANRLIGIIEQRDLLRVLHA